MTKSELIKRMSEKLDQLTTRDVDLAVHTLLEIMSNTLANGERIEIRGFGTFSNHFRKPQMVRNPRTGEDGIFKPGKFVPYFKPGKELRSRVNSPVQGDCIDGQDCSQMGAPDVQMEPEADQ
ncbi:MAG: integration host factor subunit beta [Gammaproteobacteria bacterium]|nr:integration host factor subunit beta [Gammaproteobacteria bacterium]